MHSLTVRAKIPPEQQEIQPSLWHKAPQSPCIKEEQEGEQLQGITEFPLVSVTVKSEDKEKLELPQSQPEENTDPPDNPDDAMGTKADTGPSGGPEPETKDENDLNRFNGGKMRGPFSCLFCRKRCCSKSELMKHKRGHTRERPYCKSLQSQVRDHTGEKPFRCSDCGECFSPSTPLKQHVTCHKGEKALSSRLRNNRSKRVRVLVTAAASEAAPGSL